MKLLLLEDDGYNSQFRPFVAVQLSSRGFFCIQICNRSANDNMKARSGGQHYRVSLRITQVTSQSKNKWPTITAGFENLLSIDNPMNQRIVHIRVNG